MPNGVLLPQTRPVLDPVNPIPATSKIRDALSGIAAGWDVVWHSRYIFSDHLRQQVTGRLVDGLLANIERNIQTLLTDARPVENTYWKAKLPPLEAAAATICGLCTGDPYVWGRALARNIDLHAFRVRLDQGRDSSGGHDDEAMAAWHDRRIHHYPTEHGRECQERTRGPLARHQQGNRRERSAAMV